MTRTEAFVIDRLHKMMKRPLGWGTLSAVELQVLTLLDVLAVERGQDIPENRVYTDFLAGHPDVPGPNNLGLARRLGIEHREDQTFIKVMTEYIEWRITCDSAP